MTPPHGRHPICHTFDKRKAQYGKTDEMRDFVSVNGGGNCSVAAASDAMEIDWMTKNELNEAIPPVYTRFIGEQLLAYLKDTARTGTVGNPVFRCAKTKMSPSQMETFIGTSVAT